MAASNKLDSNTTIFNFLTPDRIAVGIAALQDLHQKFSQCLIATDPQTVETLTRQFVYTVVEIYGPGPESNAVKDWQAFSAGPFVPGDGDTEIQWYRDGANATMAEIEGLLAQLRLKQAMHPQKSGGSEVGKMEQHMQFMVQQVMSNFARTQFNQKKNRWEATANGIKNTAYGDSKEAALAMLRKMVDNNVHDRPELENLEEHEAYGNGRSAQPVSQIIHNYQGVVNNVSNSKLDDVSLSVNLSIQQLNESSKELAGQLQAFLTQVRESGDLQESAKVEVIDYVDAIAVEAQKPKEQRLVHRITNGAKSITDVVKGAGALKTLWDAVEPAVKTYFGL